MIKDKQSKCHFDGRLGNSFIAGRSVFRVFSSKARLISTVGHIDVLHGAVEEGASWTIGAGEASGSSGLESANWWPVGGVGCRCVFFGQFGVGP